MKSPAEPAYRRVLPAAVWLPLALATLAYLNTLWSGFVWDDVHLIVDNTLVRRASPLPALSSDFWQEVERTDLYRPLVSLSYFVEFRLWRLWPAGYHAMNLLYHLAATLAVTWAAGLILGGPVAATAAGAVFAIHPIHTESVAFISGRPDLLATVFCVSALGLYLRRRTADGKLSIPSVLLFAAGLLSKETAVALPAGLLAWELTQGRGGARDRPGVAGRLAPYLGVVAICAGLRWAVMGSPVWRGGDPTPTGTRLVIAVNALGEYLRLLVAPFPAAPGRIPDPSWSGLTVAAAVTLVLLAVAAIQVGRRTSVPMFLLAWFLLMLLPASPLVPGRPPQITERFLYLPSAAWAWLVGWAAAALWERIDTRMVRVAASTAAVIVVGAATATTVLRNLDWRDEHRLFTRMLRSEPGSYLALVNLGQLDALGGDPARAEAYLRQALRQRPDSVPALLGLAVAESRRGRHSLAIRYGEQARALWPDAEFVHAQLGAVYGLAGRHEEAARSFREAIRRNPRRVQPRANLVLALAQARRPEEAAAALADVERLLAEQSVADPAAARVLADLRRRLIGGSR